MQATENAAAKVELTELNSATMLMHRIRCFSYGAVIGSRAFVNEAFAQAKERFGPKREEVGFFFVY